MQGCGGVSSDKQLAAALVVGRSAISNYRHARVLPEPVVCATIAGLSGIPLARVLGVVGEARGISREERAVWRKLAATAMALRLAVGFALLRDRLCRKLATPCTTYIMRNLVCPSNLSLSRLRTAALGVLVAPLEQTFAPIATKIHPICRLA
ncbi:TPA: DUF3693 domain-containing protein [Stenotrophomonas maltophilia]|uniref:DUF3693 domain-containing protein n=1 Tax=Stenotrophomonas maltophilia TaxID=40324 RepID=UPI000DA756F3